MTDALVDTRPILRSDDAWLWSDIETLKQEYFHVISEYCGQRNVLADVYKSGPGDYPAWVLVEIWVRRAPSEELRASLKIEIHSRPFMRYPVTVMTTITRGSREKRYHEARPLSPETIRLLMHYLFEGGRKPSLSGYRMGGVARWEALLVVVGLIIPLVNIAAIGYGVYLYVRHLLRRQKRVGVTRDYARLGVIAGILISAGLILVGSNIDGQQLEPSPVLIATGVVILALVIGLGILLSRRQAVVRSSGRPVEDPRLLRIIDNWGGLIRGASNAESILKTRIERLIASSTEMDLSSRFEAIEYYSPSGKQSREQFVIVRNKVIIFFHCYQFGSDLYVGWDSFLNIVAWADKSASWGTNRIFGRLVEVRDISRVYSVPTEYDLIEHNSLAAWFHERLRAEIEALATERSLTLTLDFDVTKSDRSMALSAAQRQANSERDSSRSIPGLGNLVRRG